MENTLLKNKKIMAGRGSILGDICMFLPALTVLKNKYPGCSITFPIAKKCQQIIPLLLTHPLIDSIYITDANEGLNKEDEKWILDQEFDLVFNPFPAHQKEDWYNDGVNCVEETLRMASQTLLLGYGLLSKEDKLPRLYWPQPEKEDNTIYIWPFAGYGRDLHRSPSVKWWQELLKELLLKYKITHCGSDNEPILSEDTNYSKITNLPYSEQVIKSLAGSLVLSTDSGSGWILGAYQMVPQVNFICNHLPNHHSNKLALAPLGSKCHTLYADNHCDNIPTKEVLGLIEKLVK